MGADEQRKKEGKVRNLDVGGTGLSGLILPLVPVDLDGTGPKELDAG